MAYIGNIPAEKFTSVDIQNFTVSATANYTLDRPVANENEIELFINNVRQHPGSGKAYTASGTALTLSEATAGTDTMYCVYQGKARQTVTPATSSVTNAMLAGSIDLTSKVTGALPQANIADQAINEAKLQISNAPTNGYMLTAQSGNTGGLTWAEAPSGDFVRLNSVTGTGLSDITFDNFSSTYQVYKIIGSHTMSSDNAQTRMRVRKSGSDQTSSHYRYAFSYAYRTSGGSGASYNTSWNADHVRITQGSSSADAHPTGFEFTIYSPSDSTRQSACWLNSFFYESGGANSWESWTGSIWLDSTTGVDITGIKFYPETGNFNNAKYSIYAMKDS